VNRAHPQRGSKAWGREVEARVVNLLRTVWPTAERATGPQPRHGRDIRGIPFFAQVKARKTLLTGRWYFEARDAAHREGVHQRVVLFVQESGQPPLAVLKVTDLLDLVQDGKDWR
jgi:hypothetical protein